jgi:hypothetical protein
MWWMAGRCWFKQASPRQGAKPWRQGTLGFPSPQSSVCRENNSGSGGQRPSHCRTHARQFVTGRYGDVNVVGGYDAAPNCFVKLYRT